jgi:hypothetical protein
VLPEYLSNAIERVQKRVLSIIYQDANYEANLILSGLTSLRDRHKNACMKLFIKIKQNPDHKLAGLLPPENCSCYNLRKPRELVVPRYKTNRFSKSFFLLQQRLIIVNSTQQLLLLYIYIYIYRKTQKLSKLCLAYLLLYSFVPRK